MTAPGDRTSSEISPELESLFELSLDLICVSGLDGYFKRVNPSWTRVLGWSREELLSRPVADFMHPDDRERTLLARAELAAGRPVVGLENRYLCKDGSHRWLAWQSSVRPGYRTVFAVARDITERRRAEEERLVLDKLQAASVLAGGIAHDFNNLLASLLLNLDMVGLSGPLQPDQARHVRQARETIDAARALTSRIVAFSEADAPRRSKLSVAALLRRETEPLLREISLRLDLDLPDDLWPIEADEMQMGQVVRGLLANARESLPRGRGRIRVAARNLAAPAPGAADAVQIVVEDDGAGIAPDVRPRIFDPYFSTKERGPQKGMGLGLAICHAVLRRHGGSIDIESAVGAGTRVLLRLPAARERPAGAEHVAPGAALAGRTDSTRAGVRRVLILEDEPALREVLGQMISSLGHEPACAADGAEALALDAEARRAGRPFSAAFLDLTVRDGLGGLDIIGPLRAATPGLHAVVMSGHDMNNVLREPARHGFDVALAKPFPFERLRAILGAAG